MSEEMTFSKLMDRSKLDRLEGEILALVADFEAQGYHQIDIANALQHAIMIRLKRETFINRDLYWSRMKSHVDAWFETTGEIAAEIQQFKNDDRDAKRKTRRGDPIH